MKKNVCLLTMAALLLLPATLLAANLTWDADTTVAGAQDGSGTWSTTANNWWIGSANALFSATTPDGPTFGNLNGTAGTVTLGANINSTNLVFNPASVGNYTIAGGGFTLSLTNRLITANVSATISANIVPTGIANSGLTLASSVVNGTAGILTLSGNNGFTNFNVGGNNPNTTAAVRIGSSTALGWGVVGIAGGQGSQTSHRIELVGNNMTITNSIPGGNLGRNNNSAAIVNLGTGNTWSGTLTKATGGQDSHIASEVANGLTFSGASSAGIAFNGTATGVRYFILRGSGGGTVSGVITNTGANSLGIIKAGSGTWTFSGANAYTNPTILDEGTLNLDYGVQNNSKLADAYPLLLAGGNLNLTGGSHTEVVGSTTLGAGGSSVTRASGTGILRMNVITRNRGGVVDFGAASIADTDSANVNGLLGGGYATIAGANWAINSTGAGDGAITAYSAYTDIAASGSSLADGATSNVRLNSAGGGGNITLGAATTTVNSLLQNTATAATIDTAAGILRLGAVGGVLIPSASQSLTIGTAANSGTLTAGGAANTAGEIIVINNSANPVTVNSVVANNGTGVASFTKAGSGSATLAGSNTHTGTNSIVGGTLNISSDANLGAVPGAATPSSVLLSGGTLNATADTTLSANRGIALGPTSRYGNGTIGVNGGATFFIPSIVANADLTGNGPGASLTKTGAGTLVLSAANTYANGTFINAGTVSVTADNNLGAVPQCYIPDNVVLNGGTLLASNTFTLDTRRGVRLGPVGGSGSGTVSVADSTTLTFSGVISDNWNGTGALTKTGAGTLLITGGVNDYSGNTTISAGTLQVNNSRAIPNGAGKGNVVVNGTLALNGINVALNGFSGSGGTVDNILGNSVTFSVGNNNQGGTFSGTIQNSGGALTLDKAGSATVTLNNVTATHTGSTTVSGGTLALAGTTAIGSTTNLAVGSGATLDVSGLSSTLTLNSGQTLSGKGTVVGAVNTGAGVLAPGASAGTLAVTGNLTLGSGSVMNYDVANVTTVGANVNDLTTVSGNLTVAGPTTLNLNYLNSISASGGKYTLISYGGAFAGNVTDIAVPSGFTISNNVAAKTVELLINHNSATIIWRGDGTANVWDINTTANFGPSGSPVTFFSGDTAVFDNTGANTPSINVASPGVIAGAMTVSATQNYDFTGSPVAAGAFTKNGSGTLVLENDLQFLGGIISNGTVQVGNGATSGTIGGGTLTNNGALTFNRTDAITVTNPVAGSGTLAQNGAGDVGLNASNSYTGATTVNFGRVFVMNGNALGATNSGTTVAGGAQVYITQNVNVGNESLTLNGTGPNADGTGALRKGGGGATVWGGAVTLASDSTIVVDGGASLNLTNASGISSSGQNLTVNPGAGAVGTVAGSLVLGSGGGVLTKVSPGSLVLGGSNSMSLATIPDGNLTLANNLALGTNLNVAMTSITGGPGLSGTRLSLSGNVSFGVNRTLAMPSSGGTRSAFFSTGGTNLWLGPVTLFGDSSTADVIGLGVDNNSGFVVSNVTADATFPGKLILRGTGGGTGSTVTGLGFINGNILLDPANGQLQVDDGTTWVLAGASNIWFTTIISGNSTLRLGAKNAVATNSTIIVGNGTVNRLDLAGFNQVLGGLNVTGPAIGIINSSTSSDSTLTLAFASTFSYGGTITDSPRKLNLAIATGNLTLTNPASLNLSNSTVSVAGGGAALELDYTGTNTIAALVLNGVSQSPGLYSSANASPYLIGTGNLLIGTSIASYATNLTAAVSGSTLTVSWPATHLGWILQAQTNGLGAGLGANWSDVAGSSGVTSQNIPINPANPTVFFRLRHP
jgi:autotransporter-associated beta strand protein